MSIYLARIMIHIILRNLIRDTTTNCNRIFFNSYDRIRIYIINISLFFKRIEYSFSCFLYNLRSNFITIIYFCYNKIYLFTLVSLIIMSCLLNLVLKTKNLWIWSISCQRPHDKFFFIYIWCPTFIGSTFLGSLFFFLLFSKDM